MHAQLAVKFMGRRWNLEPRAPLLCLPRLGFRTSWEGTLLEGSPRDWDSVVPEWVLGISYYFETSVVPMMCSLG